MSILTVSPFAEKKSNKEKQLLLAEDFPNITENNQLVYLYSQSKDFFRERAICQVKIRG